ncbi:MAG: SIS domain-containing protein, partial [Thaumarchaeota archaeon]|nr:SIS domain-containing protein [Nitrososphaerota archaeon]
MLDISTLNKIDKQGMHKIYDNWPQMALDAYNIKPKSRNYKNVDHIVFAGMGGSGAIGDLFSAILSKTRIHVSLVKGYVLPNTVDSNTLVVTISISGDTIETLTVLKSAKKIGCKVIAFSSGGKMELLCKKNNIDFQKINLTHSPRASFINYVYSILRTLETIMPIKKQDILQSISDLTNLSKQIRSSNLTEHNPSLSIAKWITGIPLIYYPWGLQAIAVRFKSSLQENAKSHAIIEDVIEASHNGIMSWERSSSVRPILLQGQDDYIKTK